MIRHIWPLALLLPLLAVPAPAQRPQQKAQEKTQQKTQQKTQPPKWPALSKADQARGVKWLKLLASKKAKTRQKATDELIALGAGMGRRLFLRLNDSPRNINDRVVEVLDRVLRPEHSAVIATQGKHKSVFARRYVFKKFATFAPKGLDRALREARKDKDVEVSYYAALALVRTAHDVDALQQIFKRCEEEWGEIGDEVSRFLKGIRSEKFTPWIHEKLKSKEITEHIALLRIMRSIAPPELKSLMRRFLDSEDSILKKEAINTLRVIVDGKEPIPLKKITVFQIIKLARAWKARI
jgi:hypothetical protein